MITRVTCNSILFCLLSFACRAQVQPAFAGILTTTVTAAPTLHNIDLLIDHTKCGSSNSSNFPVLVSISDASIKTQANGGYVYRSDGNDIEFFADNARTMLLNWEVESYDGTAGTLIAWVSIPTVSHTADVTFYLQCGSTSITTFQGGSAGTVWTNDGSYKGVWHLGSPIGLVATDATTTGANGTITVCNPSTGIINGGPQFYPSPSNSFIDFPYSSAFSSTTGTWSFWMNTSQTVSGTYPMLMCQTSPSSHNGFLITLQSGSGNLFIQFYGSSYAGCEFDNTTYSPHAALNDGAWHYVSFSFAGTGAPVLYVDGSATTFTGSSPSTWSFAGDDIRIGESNDMFWGQNKGQMDEVRISNNNRGADWVLTEYNNQNGPGNIGSNNFLSYSAWH